MKKHTMALLTGIFFSLLAASGFAGSEGTDPPAIAAETSPPAVIPGPTPENTLALCGDKIDNDTDSHVDCADQDCQIFAVCVQTSAATTPPAITVVVPPAKPAEKGKLCTDGLDNDENGKIDCHDLTCQATRHCKREMYEREEPKNKPQGFFMSGSLGFAFPNYNWSDIRTDSDYGDNVPFDADLGGMIGLKLGVVPSPWFGFGLNLNGGGTFATNRSTLIKTSDDPDDYKYYGHKAFGHIGGFVRVQYPMKKVVPYLDITGGYSFARYEWDIYSGRYSWDDIDEDWDDWDDDDNNNYDLPSDHRSVQDDHFTFALEPGVDVYIIPRTLALGANVRLPVFASSDSGMDNIGLNFTVTWTPTWAEPAKLKPAYAPQSK